jgi:hypothetical protein
MGTMPRHNDTTTDLMLHLRLDGRSDEMPLAALGLTGTETDEQIKQALAARLDCAPSVFDGHVIARHSTTIVVRPEAIYG